MKQKSGKKKLAALFAARAYDAATDTNYEGAPGFRRSPEEQLVRLLTTGGFEQTFYPSGRELAREAVALFRQFADADPHFLAQAIIYARQEGFMRTAPITALVVLSAADKPDTKELFRRTFPKVIQTPGDLQDFLTICRQKTLRGMGKLVTHAVQCWLAQLSQYHATKYGSERQDMSLRDIYRLTRPKLEGEPNAIARYLVKGEVATQLTQISGYEEFKRAARDMTARTATLSEDERQTIERRLLTLIEEHRLPWEVVVGQMPGSTAVWDAMLRQMPYMALLRNLSNAVRYGVTARPDALAYIVATLCDPQRVKASRQFPFAFYAALKMLEARKDAPEALLAAVADALEQSFANVPDLGQRVLVANDISGSMAGKPSEHSDMTMAEVAGLFAAAVYKKAESGEIVSFDTEAHPRSVSKDQSLRSLVAQVAAHGGGTSLSAPLEYAFGKSHADRLYDVAVFLTDSESWYDHLTRHRGVLDLIREYRARVNAKLQCFFVQLLPYKHAVAPQDEPGCHYVYGWSGSVLTFIGSIIDGGESQLEHVRQVTVL